VTFEPEPPSSADSSPQSTKEIDVDVQQHQVEQEEAAVARCSALPEDEADSRRPPQWSAGSSQHGTGNCRPCGHFWKSTSCFLGAACNFCHLCSRDAARLAHAEKRYFGKVHARERKRELRRLQQTQLAAPEAQLAPEGAVIDPEIAQTAFFFAESI